MSADARSTGERPLEIPERSGETLLVPAGPTLLQVAADNRRRLDTAEAQIGGMGLPALRRRAREEILPLARRYTAALGEGSVQEGELVLATGHQPGFPHPGIWVKDLLVDRLAARGHTGLVVIVDSDAMEDLGVDVPAHPGAFLECHHETLRAAAGETPYEVEAAPGDEEWQAFLTRLDHHLQTVREPAIREQWERFRRRPRPTARDLSGFLAMLRRAHEGRSRYLEVPISEICATEAFQRFVLHVARDAQRFRTIHNRHLDAYRQSERIRTEAQPFPNLDATEDRVELPFWTLQQGRRRRAFLDLPAMMVRTRDAAVGPLPQAPGDPEFHRLGLRPRAITLTAFVRLALTDLFIHGVSGARYDRVTDRVIADFLGISPPRYAAATVTLHLPFHESMDPAAARQALQRIALEARHNPERLIHEPDAGQRVLIDQKWKEIHRLQDAVLSRRERREATLSIRTINEQLSAALAGHLTEVEAALAALDGHRGPTEAATHRAYPYFLFPPEQVGALADRMLLGETDGSGGTVRS